MKIPLHLVGADPLAAFVTIGAVVKAGVSKDSPECGARRLTEIPKVGVIGPPRITSSRVSPINDDALEEVQAVEREPWLTESRGLCRILYGALQHYDFRMSFAKHREGIGDIAWASGANETVVLELIVNAQCEITSTAHWDDLDPWFSIFKIGGDLLRVLATNVDSEQHARTHSRHTLPQVSPQSTDVEFWVS